LQVLKYGTRQLLGGRAEAIWAERDRKLEAARARRRTSWQERSTERHAALTGLH